MSHTQRYTLLDFERLKSNVSSVIIPQDVLLTLEALAACVTAPDYTKTPHFLSKHHDKQSKKLFKNSENGEEDWATIRNFVTSKFVKKEGDILVLDTLRKNMNKLSETNISVIYKYIIEDYDKISDELLKTQCIELILSIMKGNSVLSKTNSKFFELLRNHDEKFKDILNKHIDNFKQSILVLNFCSPDENYEEFCENNKKNELIKASACFYLDLFNLSIIDIDWIISHVIFILNKIFSLAQEDNKKMLVDFFSELSYIFITRGWNNIKTHKDAQQIMDLVITVSNIKIRSLPSITNKCIFKHMDILDYISDK